MKTGKSRLTHGQKSQCAKRLNDGPPEGGLGWKNVHKYLYNVNGNHYWRGKSRLISDGYYVKTKNPLHTTHVVCRGFLYKLAPKNITYR